MRAYCENGQIHAGKVRADAAPKLCWSHEAPNPPRQALPWCRQSVLSTLLVFTVGRRRIGAYLEERGRQTRMASVCAFW